MKSIIIPEKRWDEIMKEAGNEFERLELQLIKKYGERSDLASEVMEIRRKYNYVFFTLTDKLRDA